MPRPVTTSAPLTRDRLASNDGLAGSDADRGTDDVIEILWHVGFLAAQPASGIRPPPDDGRSFLGTHQIQHPNLPAVQRFQVHPMFRSYLGIAQRTRP